MRRSLLALILAVGAGTVPLPAQVTYQGTLADGGTPADGIYDLRFTLFDSATDGTTLDTFAAEDVPVTGGLFVLGLSFEAVELDGSAMWLGIEVRPGDSTGSFTALEPRQLVSAAPYALFAEHGVAAGKADGALDAGDTDTLDGEHGSFYRAWSSRTGVPVELADGDDDGLGDLACDAGEIAAFDGVGWACSPDRGRTYARTVVVGPVGDAAANGAALLAAVASLPVPASREGAWRLLLEPGRYDLGSSQLVLPPYLALVGGGERITVITSTHCDIPPDDGGTVVGAIGVEIRDLTAECVCGSDTENGTAVLLPEGADDARLIRVTANATGPADANKAVDVASRRAILERVTATAENSDWSNLAIYARGASTLLLDCGGYATAGPTNIALMIEGSALVRRGIYSSTSETGTDRAIYISDDADLQEVVATGGDNSVLVVVDSATTVLLSRLTAQGEVYTQVNDGSLTMLIEHSRIVSTGETLFVGSGASVGVAATQLWGDPVNGTAACSGVWDESWVFYANTCP